MKINWAVRFKNGKWLASFLAFIVSTVYTLLGMFDLAPALTENQVMQVVCCILMVLAGLGVISDPTTPGIIRDSERAMNYVAPGVEGKPPDGDNG